MYGHIQAIPLKHKKQRKGWNEFINCIDVLVDGKYQEENRDLALCFRGSSNQRIIDMQKTLRAGELNLLGI